jgi:hypothetical protein
MKDRRFRAALFALSAASCLALVMAPSAGAVSFTPPTSFATGSSPLSVAVADFDGDGNRDLAVANAGSNTVSVLLGDGNGGFGPATGFDTFGSAPAAVVAEDFDFDGNPDLAVTNRGDDTVSFLLGDGAGGFTWVDGFDVGDSPTALAAGRLSSFGPGSDLVVANQGSDTVSRLFNDSSFSFDFGFPRDFAAGDGPTAVATGDFNFDQGRDLVVADRSSDSVSVLLNQVVVFSNFVTGDFDPPVAYATGSVPVGVAVGNFNAGGDPDLAVADSGSNKVSILMGGSGGTFGAKTDLAMGFRPSGVVVGDFDGDLHADVATSNLGSDDVTVRLGDGAGSFGAQQAFAAARFPSALATGDFNGDGDPDLAVANQGSGTVSILLNNTHDIVPPNTQIDSGPADGSRSNDTSPSFTYEGIPASDTDHFECKLDSGPFATCPSSGIGYSGLGDGEHTFAVRAVDARGNEDLSPATVTWTVDTDPPETTLDSGPSGDTGMVNGVLYTNDETPSFTFSSDEPGSTFECKFDDADYYDCVSNDAFDRFVNGDHTVSVRAVDEALNPDPTPVSIRFRVAACTINGTAASDRIVDGSAPNVICAGGGDDRVLARGGNDIIFGAGGADYVVADGGNDVALGGPGNDYLSGGAGNDGLDGGPGTDTCEGGRGTDTASPECEKTSGIP